MFHKIKKIETLHNLILKIEFDNGEIKFYDVKKAINKIKGLELLNNEELFKNVSIDVGGYAAVWSDDLDISCNELYNNGVDEIN